MPKITKIFPLGKENKKLKYNKIFVIGFNKTASSTFHHLFEKLGYKSQHYRRWDLNNYDCFSDNGELQNLKTLYTFPNSLFILNTRNLHDWLFSRAKHSIHYRVVDWNKDVWGFPPSSELYIRWIKEREEYFERVLNFFEKDKEKLTVVSIERKNWVQFVANAIGHEYPEEIHEHHIPVENLNEYYVKKASDSLNEAYIKLNYEEKDKNVEFLKDDSLLKNYSNNIITKEVT